VQALSALEERLRILDERISHLKLDWAESGDPAIQAALASISQEAARVRAAIVTARPLEDEPHDAAIVELGDTVTVRMAPSHEAERERFTLVGELEARLDDSWISVESPMGSALLGGSIHDAVDVVTPAGTVRYEILAIDRR
jgi:transcription elongation factor GreA